MRLALAVFVAFSLACASLGPGGADVGAPAGGVEDQVEWQGIPVPLPGGKVSDKDFADGPGDRITLEHPKQDEATLVSRYIAHAEAQGWEVNVRHKGGGARLVRGSVVIQINPISLLSGKASLVVLAVDDET